MTRVCVFIPRKIYIYDGKTGEKVCALGGNKAHDGGIYAVSTDLPAAVVGRRPCLPSSVKSWKQGWR